MSEALREERVSCIGLQETSNLHKARTTIEKSFRWLSRWSKNKQGGIAPRFRAAWDAYMDALACHVR